MYYLLCEVYISTNGERVMDLGSGTSAVIRFWEYAKQGIEGVIKYEYSFSCNVDVTIKGKDLLRFINDKYPENYERALKYIENNENEYTIVCYDLS